MNEILIDKIANLFVHVILPLLTLLVLWFGLRVASRTLVRSVTPQVECFLRPRPSSDIFELVIANYGLGSAYNVSLNLEVDEDDFDAHRVATNWRTTEVPFGIIEPGGSINIFFGMGNSLLGNESPLKPFNAVVEYEWQPFWAKHRRKEKRSYNMDVRPFKGIPYFIEKNEIAETLKSELKKIADFLKPQSRRPPIPRDRRSEDRTTLERMESLMPSLFAEMRNSLNSHPLKREFIVVSQGSIFTAGRKEPLAFYYESHENLADEVGVLVNEGLVTDIRYNAVDRYVMSEPLVQYLLEVQNEEEEL